MARCRIVYSYLEAKAGFRFDFDAVSSQGSVISTSPIVVSVAGAPQAGCLAWSEMLRSR